MSKKVWVKLWKADLLSSLNYQGLSISGKGIYNILMTLCRDDEYSGQLCYPNGNPMTIDQIIDCMNPRKGDRTDRIKESINQMFDVGLLFINDQKCIEIRNYAKKTRQGSQEVGNPPLDNQGVITKSQFSAKTHSDTDSDTDSDKEHTPPIPQGEVSVLEIIKDITATKTITTPKDRIALDLAQQFIAKSPGVPLGTVKEKIKPYLGEGISAMAIQRFINDNSYCTPTMEIWTLLKAAKEWYYKNRQEINEQARKDKERKEWCPDCEGTGCDYSKLIMIDTVKGKVKSYGKCEKCKGAGKLALKLVKEKL